MMYAGLASITIVIAHRVDVNVDDIYRVVVVYFYRIQLVVIVAIAVVAVVVVVVVCII
jgi:hypothetical protein